MKYLIYIAIVGSLVGCGSSKDQPTRQLTNTVIDSTTTVVRVVPKDTIIAIPGDSLKIEIPIAEIQKAPIIKKSFSGRSRAKIGLKNEVLTVECFTDSLKHKIQLQHKEIETLRKIASNKQEVIYQDVPYVPFWTKLFAGIGKVVVFLIGGAVIVLVGRMAIKRFKPI